MAPPARDRVTLQAAFAGVRRVPTPVNEPNKSYAPGSPERVELKARLKAMASEKIDIPLIIGGREIRTGRNIFNRRSTRRRSRGVNGRLGPGTIAPRCC